MRVGRLWFESVLAAELAMEFGGGGCWNGTGVWKWDREKGWGGGHV